MAQSIVAESYLTNLGNTDRLVVQMDKELYRLRPSAAPLTVIMNKARKATVRAPEWKWQEMDEAPLWSTCPAGTAAGTESGSGTVVVAAGEGIYFKPKDVVRVVATGEVLYVTAVATDTLTVVRGWGDSLTAAIPANADLLIWGNAHEENSLKGEQRNLVEATLNNYTQIFRESFGASRTQIETEQYNEQQWAKLQKDSGIRFHRELEFAFLFGEKGAFTIPATGKLVHTTQGITSRITTKIKDFTTTISAQAFDEALESGFEYGSDTKVLVCGRRFITLLNQIGRNNIQTSVGGSTYGFKWAEWVSPHGTVKVIPHPLLTKQYSTWAYLLDMDSISMKVLRGCDIHLNTNIQENDRDGRVDEYMCELGFEVKQEKRHMILKANSNATAIPDAGW
jgi:hypothetical protein